LVWEELQGDIQLLILYVAIYAAQIGGLPNPARVWLFVHEGLISHCDVVFVRFTSHLDVVS